MTATAPPTAAPTPKPSAVPVPAGVSGLLFTLVERAVWLLLKYGTGVALCLALFPLCCVAAVLAAVWRLCSPRLPAWAPLAVGLAAGCQWAGWLQRQGWAHALQTYASIQREMANALIWGSPRPTWGAVATYAAVWPHALGGGTVLGCLLALLPDRWLVGGNQSPTHARGNQPTNATATPRPLRADQLDRAKDAVQAWVAEGVAGAGLLTGVAGPPKIGKSTLLWELIAAVRQERPFLDLPTQKAPVLVLTEETAAEVRRHLRDFGLRRDRGVTVITHAQWPAVPWDARLAHIEASAAPGTLVFVDTLAKHVAQQPGVENNPGLMTVALSNATAAAARRRLAFVFNHHTGKDGRMRGTTAIMGALNIGFTFDKPEDAGIGDTRRLLVCQGARGPETPERVEVEVRPERGPLHARRYVFRVVQMVRHPFAADDAAEDAESVAPSAANAPIRAPQPRRLLLLPTPAPRPAISPKARYVLTYLEGVGEQTASQIAEHLGVHRATVKPWLDELQEKTVVTRSGTGNRIDPYRYRASA